MAQDFDVKEPVFSVIYVKYIFLAWKSKSYLNYNSAPSTWGLIRVRNAPITEEKASQGSLWR